MEKYEKQYENYRFQLLKKSLEGLENDISLELYPAK
jgi:hypothetical protein